MLSKHLLILGFSLSSVSDLILTWIRIRILGSTFGKSGSGSGYSDPPFRNSGSGSGSSDPRLEKVVPDPDPGQKWIRIRVPIINIFHIFFYLPVLYIVIYSLFILLN